MTDAILVLNAGSSSIKFAGYGISAGGGDGGLALLGGGQIDGLRTSPRFRVKTAAGDLLASHDWSDETSLRHAEAIRFIVEWIQTNAMDVRVVAAGHRVVFGGQHYPLPVRIDNTVLNGIEALVPFFPLHLPHNLSAIRAVADEYPDLPQVACFDTSFHRTQPRLAQLFALPRRFHEEGVRRYGFHGLSYEYIARRLPEFAPATRRAVVLHLGSGVSMCAIRDGESVESSMGFSGVDGLPMGTRTGALDPGVILYLMEARGYDAAAIESLIYKESGLLGVSGISNDMRDLEASPAPEAAEAIEFFVYHIAKHLGALAAAAEGLDAIVFTAGIGENSPLIRSKVCQRSAWLGVELDPSANESGGPRITKSDSTVSAWVIPTDEERMIAIHTTQVLA